MEDLKLITNHLNLSAGTTPDAVLNAIKKRENELEAKANDLTSALNKAKKEKDESEDKFSKLEKDMKAKKEEYDALKAEYDKMKSDAKDAKDKADADAKAKDETDTKEACNKYVAEGRIKLEAVDGWVSKVKAGKLTVAEVKSMIEELPASKPANKVVDQVDGSKMEEKGSQIGLTMAEVRNRLEKKQRGE